MAKKVQTIFSPFDVYEQSTRALIILLEILIKNLQLLYFAKGSSVAILITECPFSGHYFSGHHYELNTAPAFRDLTV